MNFSAQGGNSRSLAIAPNYAACKMALGAEGVEVLQESDAEGRLAGPARPADNAREWRLKFEIVSHAAGRCSLLLTSRRSKWRGSVRPSFISERDGRLVTQTPALEKRDPEDLILRQDNYIYYTSSSTFPLTLDLVLSVHCQDRFLFQDQVPDDVEID